VPTVPDAAQTAWAAFIRLFDELRKICREFIGILPMLYDYHMDFPEPQFSALSPLHSQAHKFETSFQVISATHPQCSVF
jgi:alpha-ketoglutarate-dependent taurine dioxygenase